MTTEDHILLEATTLEQKKYIWALNAVEWKGPLTIPQYVAREVAMMQGRAHRVPQKVWYLAEKSNPDVVLCACESFKRPMYVAQRRLDGSLEVNVTYGHAIASVYCREANRKKGYASEMMRQLGKALETDPWDRTMETPCSYLYSDIGKEYYSRFGWKTFPSMEIHMDALPTLSEEEQEARYKAAGLKCILKSELDSVAERDSMEVKKKLESNIIPDDFIGMVSVVPTGALLEWQQLREECEGPIVTGRPPPETKGARLNADTWCLWLHDYRKKVLLILRVCSYSGSLTSSQHVQNVKTLLEAARVEAGVWGFSEVVIWNPTAIIAQATAALANEQGMRETLIERADDSLPALRWSGYGGPAASDKLLWLDNERYAWC